LASTGLMENLTGAGIDATILGSDHCPVWATLTFADQLAGERIGESGSLQNVARRPPPRLCARYLSHLAPTQSIRSLFTNVPGHIVLRSTENLRPNTSPVETNKKRDGSELKQSRAKRTKGSGALKLPSNDASSTGQRSMSEFLKIKDRPTSQSAEAQGINAQDQPFADITSGTIAPADEVDLDDRGSSKTTASQKWTSIFTRKGPPMCDAHGAPCIELVTKKTGPNLGRRFWICSKPVGPGYDNGKRTISKGALTNSSGQKWEINPEYRCNFFKYIPKGVFL
jgi:AP endonuclease 2